MVYYYMAGSMSRQVACEQALRLGVRVFGGRGWREEKEQELAAMS